MTDIDTALTDIPRVKELLAEFGLTLRGIVPGISASFTEKPHLRGRGFWGEAISLQENEWKWLRPLLEELRDRRRAARERTGPR